MALTSCSSMSVSSGQMRSPASPLLSVRMLTLSAQNETVRKRLHLRWQEKGDFSESPKHLKAPQTASKPKDDKPKKPIAATAWRGGTALPMSGAASKRHDLGGVTGWRGQECRPLLHECAALLDQVRSRIGLLGGVAHEVTQRDLKQFALEARSFTAPIAKRRSKSMNGQAAAAMARQRFAQAHGHDRLA